jgi:hypothetical protein
MKPELGDFCVILILDVRDGDTPTPGDLEKESAKH